MLAFSVLKLSIVGLLLNEYFARIGLGYLALLGYKPAAPLVRFGTGFLAGLGIIGPAFLGLAFSGLFSAIPILAVMAALASGSRGFLTGRPVLWEAGVELGGARLPVLAAILAGLAPVIFFLFVPSLEQDSYTLHLGAPWQYLQAHRILLESIPFTFHFSHPLEMSFAIPLLLGDDRLASWMVFTAFMSVAGIFASGRIREGRGLALVAGILLAVSLFPVLSFISTAKIDPAAAAYFAAGCFLWRERKWPVGALLMGFSIAAKEAYAPFVGLWMLFSPPAFRSIPAVAVLSSIPLLPWLVKSYIASGNPLFPLTTAFFPVYFWGPSNESALRSYLMGLWQKDSLVLADVPRAWWISLGHGYMLAALAAPILLVVRSSRMALLACLAGQVFTLATGHLNRFWIPPLIWISMESMRHLPEVLPRGHRVMAGLLASMAFIQIWTFPLFTPYKAKNAFLSEKEGLIKDMTAYGLMLGRTGELKTRRPLVVGELRTYRIPGRMLYNGFLGETPLVWKIARESADLRDLYKKFRQTGADYLVYNFVSSEWTQKYCGDYFRWDKRMMDLYREYCRTRLVYSWDSASCDYVHGGFYVYRVLTKPVSRPPGRILQVPGAEAYFQDAYNWGLRNNFNMAIEQMLKVVKDQPDILMFRGELAYFYSKKGDWPSTYKWVKEPFDVGLRDMICSATYGLSAASTARYGEAYPVLKEAMGKFVFAGNVIPITMGLVCFGRAIEESKRNDAGAVEKLLDEGEKALEKMPFPVSRSDQQDIDVRLALLRGLRGDLLSWKGECDKAGEMYREALRLAPGLPSSGAWKDRAADPCRGRGRVQPAVSPPAVPRP